MRDYKESNEKIVASEELIYKTMAKINEEKKVSISPMVMFRRLAIGAVAMIFLAFSSVATYAVVTGNVQILQFFGIKISENYEKEAVETNLIINEQTNLFTKEEIKMESFAIDNSFAVMEYIVKLDQGVQCETPKLKIDEFSIYSSNISSYIPFEFEEEQVAEKIDENQYHIFVILHPTGLKEGYISYTPYAELGLTESPNAYASSEYNLLDYSFGKYSKYNEKKEGMEYYYSSDTAKFKVIIENMKNENGEIIAENLIKNEVVELVINRKNLPEKQECNWEFYTNNVKSEYIENGDIKFKLWNIENKLMAHGNLTKGSFANIISVNMYEQDNSINKTDIDKTKILVKDENGEEVPQLYYYENFVELNNGAREVFFTIILDETKEAQQYTIEVIKKQ